MPLQTEESTRKDVAFLARQLPLPRYRHVLDLCCGYGRHALGLAERGYQVTGLDRDDEAIAEARRRAGAGRREVAYVVGDIREIGALPGTFDAMINMWQSLSYFDEETNAAELRQLCQKLTPGGRFIIDLYNREYFERRQGHKRQKIDGITVDSDGYIEGMRWHSVLTYRDETGVVGGDHMDWQVYTPAELLSLATECDFTSRLLCTWADEAVAPSPEIARMQVVLARD